MNADAPQDPDVTRILREMDAGDPEAAQRLFDLLYDQLKALAKGRMKGEKPGDTLQATALVHEFYLRFLGSKRPTGHEWEDRHHFIKAAAKTMRHIVIDHAREKGADKRGGDVHRVEIDPANLTLDARPEHLLELDAALNELKAIAPEEVDLVELRFFGRLEVEEAAEALGISEATAYRYWRYARAWLRDRLVGRPRE